MKHIDKLIAKFYKHVPNNDTRQTYINNEGEFKDLCWKLQQLNQEFPRSNLPYV